MARFWWWFFSFYWCTNSNKIARLNADGTADSTFNPNANADVYSIVTQSDGKILVGGAFTTISGQTRNFIARLTNNTPALQSLTVNAGGITWTRNGSAPQFNRVTFEQSTNNGTTWTLLGSATPSLAGLNKAESLLAPTASGYNLNGLSIPSGQNVLIRATGYSNGGYQNGSQIPEELVKNVFLLAPTAANVSVSGRVLTSNGRGLSNATISIHRFEWRITHDAYNIIRLLPIQRDSGRSNCCDLCQFQAFSI